MTMVELQRSQDDCLQQEQPVEITNENDMNANHINQPKRRKFEIISDVALQDPVYSNTEIENHVEHELKKYAVRTVQTEKFLSAETPRKEKLKNRIEEFKRIIKEKDAVIKKYKKEKENDDLFLAIDHDKLPKELAHIVESQIRNNNRHRKGRRYTEDLKQFALSIYFLAPMAYKFMEKIMHLPAENTLLKHVSSWPSGPGLKDAYFKALELKGAQLPGIAKKCSVIMDEMSLKACLQFNKKTEEIVGLVDDGTTKENTVAKSVFVIMVQGITVRYKHLLGYAFVDTALSAHKVKQMVTKAIQKLQDIGFDPQIVISDQGSNFQRFAKEMGISTSNSSFQVNGKKVYFTFGPPHLIKSVRNNLMARDFIYDEDEKRATWKDIKEFYKLDRERVYRLAPKLTDIHVIPNRFQRMRVPFAVQVFSHSVSSEIYTHYSGNQAPACALGTAEFLENMDNLFYMFNSWKFKETNSTLFC